MLRPKQVLLKILVEEGSPFLEANTSPVLQNEKEEKCPRRGTLKQVLNENQ